MELQKTQISKIIFLLITWIAFQGCRTEEKLLQAPEVIVTGVSSIEGFIGDTIIISGINFSKKLEENIVEFNSIKAPIIKATSTEVHTIVPAFTTNGTVKIGRVGGRMATVGEFSVLPSFRPEIKEVKDAEGNSRRTFTPGEIMVIEGKGFNNQANRNIVVFNNVLVPVSEVISVDENTIRLFVPGNAVSGPMSVNVVGSTSLPVDITINEVDPTEGGRIYWSETNVAPFGVPQFQVGASLFKGEDNVRTRPPGKIIFSDTNFVNLGINGGIVSTEYLNRGDIDPDGDYYYNVYSESDFGARATFRILHLKTSRLIEIPLPTQYRITNAGTSVFARKYNYQGREATALFLVVQRGTSNLELVRYVLNRDKTDFAQGPGAFKIVRVLPNAGCGLGCSREVFITFTKSRIFYNVFIFNRTNNIFLPIAQRFRPETGLVIDFEGNQAGNIPLTFFVEFFGEEYSRRRTVVASSATDRIYFQETFFGATGTVGSPVRDRNLIRGDYSISYTDVVSDPNFQNLQKLYGPFDLATERDFLIDNGQRNDLELEPRQSVNFDLSVLQRSTLGENQLFFVRDIRNEGSVIFSIRLDGKSLRPQRLYQGSLRRIDNIYLSKIK